MFRCKSLATPGLSDGQQHDVFSQIGELKDNHYLDLAKRPALRYMKIKNKTINKRMLEFIKQK